MFHAVRCEEHVKNYKRGNELHYSVLVGIKTYRPRLKTGIGFGKSNLKLKFLQPSTCLMNSSKKNHISRTGTEQAKFMPYMTNLIKDWNMSSLLFDFSCCSRLHKFASSLSVSPFLCRGIKGRFGMLFL